MSRHLVSSFVFLPAAFFVAVLSGCAVQTNSRGGYVFGVDTAQVFGQEIERFSIQDGQEGVLRHEGERFSVKFTRYQRVVPLPAGTRSARIARVENLGSRSVVVVETQQVGCDFRYVLLAVEGSSVLNWELGNCSDRPIALVTPDRSAMAFDFPKGNRIERYVYTQDGRLLRGDDDPAPGLNMAARPFADASLNPSISTLVGGQPGSVLSAGNGRVVPAPPQQRALARPAGGDSKPPAAAVVRSSRPAPASTRVVSRPAGPPVQNPLGLQREVIPPVRIDLGN